MSSLPATNKVGVIVGAVIGALLLLLLLLLLIWLLVCCCHKRRYEKEVANEIRYCVRAGSYFQTPMKYSKIWGSRDGDLCELSPQGGRPGPREQTFQQKLQFPLGVGVPHPPRGALQLREEPPAQCRWIRPQCCLHRWHITTNYHRGKTSPLIRPSIWIPCVTTIQIPDSLFIFTIKLHLLKKRLFT